ncbi:hypothetical protein J6590_050596 [Homalodisca vitripennis]|nr:hypothetical protein J6590_050596 [Homalodisca vitripennis]
MFSPGSVESLSTRQDIPTSAGDKYRFFSPGSVESLSTRQDIPNSAEIDTACSGELCSWNPGSVESSSTRQDIPTSAGDKYRFFSPGSVESLSTRQDIPNSAERDTACSSELCSWKYGTRGWISQTLLREILLVQVNCVHGSTAQKAGPQLTYHDIPNSAERDTACSSELCSWKYGTSWVVEQHGVGVRQAWDRALRSRYRYISCDSWPGVPTPGVLCSSSTLQSILTSTSSSPYL